MVDVISMLTARMQPEVTCAFVNADRDSQILRHLDLSSAKVMLCQLRQSRLINQIVYLSRILI